MRGIMWRRQDGGKAKRRAKQRPVQRSRVRRLTESIKPTSPRRVGAGRGKGWDGQGLRLQRQRPWIGPSAWWQARQVTSRGLH